MDASEKLFIKVLHELDKAGVLQKIVLIGGWALAVYKKYFDDDPEIPILRTTDVDFLVGITSRITVNIDVPSILSELGFEVKWAAQGGYCKYIHPDLIKLLLA